MSGGMGDMMKEMGEMEHMKSHGTQPLFPSLMELPDLSPGRRDALGRQAHERTKAGTTVVSDGLDRLSRALLDDDYGPCRMRRPGCARGWNSSRVAWLRTAGWPKGGRRGRSHWDGLRVG
jgi:hypothetical protein